MREDKISVIIQTLSKKWGIDFPYFYPLVPSYRTDLISFDKNYVDDSLKIEFIRNILLIHKVKKLYELKENGSLSVRLLSDAEILWRNSNYFWMNEGYWFDENYDWIIYSSHEQTVTFGGEWLIRKVKKEWNDWNENLKWNSSN